MEGGGDTSCGVESVFSEFGAVLGREAELREQLRVTVRELEQTGRDIHTLLQRVHRPGGSKDCTGLIVAARQRFTLLADLFSQLDTKLPPDQYWKYNHLWTNTASWVAFLASLTIYLETGLLASKVEVEELLGLTSSVTVRLDIEEYLIGLTHLSNELARLSVNCVTSEDFTRPEKIAEFINSLNSGFRLLNLKNDGLRKKFDGLKYDLKKVEEVVYDLSIRGLNKPPAKSGDEGEPTKPKEDGAGVKPEET